MYEQSPTRRGCSSSEPNDEGVTKPLTASVSEQSGQSCPRDNSPLKRIDRFTLTTIDTPVNFKSLREAEITLIIPHTIREFYTLVNDCLQGEKTVPVDLTVSLIW